MLLCLKNTSDVFPEGLCAFMTLLAKSSIDIISNILVFVVHLFKVLRKY